MSFYLVITHSYQASTRLVVISGDSSACCQDKKLPRIFLFGFTNWLNRNFKGSDLKLSKFSRGYRNWFLISFVRRSINPEMHWEISDDCVKSQQYVSSKLFLWIRIAVNKSARQRNEKNIREALVKDTRSISQLYSNLNEHLVVHTVFVLSGSVKTGFSSKRLSASEENSTQKGLSIIMHHWMSNHYVNYISKSCYKVVSWPLLQQNYISLCSFRCVKWGLNDQRYFI